MRHRHPVLEGGLARGVGAHRHEHLAEVAGGRGDPRYQALHHRGLLCIPHGWKSGLTVAAEVHLSAAASNVPLIEFMVPELWPSIIRSELVEPEFTPRNGVIDLPKASGLGVRLNEEIARKLAWPAMQKTAT